MIKLKTILIPLLFALTSVAFASEPVQIKMKSITFDPKVVQIDLGQSVRWKNSALTDHTATAEDAPPTFDTGVIHPGKLSKEVRFDHAGQYKYHCSIHGQTMSGIIQVQDPRGK
jgi:plastocyanin